MKEIYEHILEAISAGEKGVLATVIEVKGSAPRHSGSKMLIHPDGRIFGSIGGGKLEAEVIKKALQSIEKTELFQHEFQLLEEQEMWCGGTVKILFEPFGGQERLIVFGAGHIGHALSALAADAGYHVTVVDNRPDFALKERLPKIDEVICGEYQDVISRIEFNERTYIVIVTHKHESDGKVLSLCVNKTFAYLGVIGSKRKTLKMIGSLEAQGVSPERLALIRSPIGLNIGAETPFEISVSILAEMIAVRHGVKIDTMSMKLPGQGA